jgi:DNA-binding NarL/FixJ family response regulator
MMLARDFPPALPVQAAGVLRLVIVEDHDMVREGLLTLLELEVDFDVVGAAGNALEGIALAHRLVPDVVITDLGLGEHDGIYLIAEVRKLVPAARILVLTAHGDHEHIRGALAAGARGYVLKDAGRPELVQAIRAVGANEYFLCGPVSNAVVSNFLAKGSVPEHSVAAPLTVMRLSEREREIAALIAQGVCNRRIGVQLQRSIKTVAKHRANIMRKIGAHSAAEITRFAVYHQLIPSDVIAQQS